MAASGLPQINTSELEKRHQTSLSNFTMRAEKLSKRPLDKLTAELAQELDTDAKVWLADAEKERVEMKKPILEAARKQDAFWEKMMTPARQARAVCTGYGVKFSDGGIVGRFEREQRRAKDAKRLADEAAERAAAEARKQAEVAALVEEAAATNDESLLEEAARVEAEPAQPMAVSVEPVELPDGASVGKEKPILKSITDPYALMQWLMASKERFESIWPDTGKFERFIESTINAALGRGLKPDGIETHLKAPMRNLNR